VTGGCFLSNMIKKLYMENLCTDSRFLARLWLQIQDGASANKRITVDVVCELAL
jgi:hypothetical protein